MKRTSFASSMVIGVAVSLWLADASRVDAGMPSLRLSEIAQLRVENISFFLFLFILVSLAIRWVWNGLAAEWPILPKLSYIGSLGISSLWGFLFAFVLTMISGARELMTPGAWEPNGATYKLAKKPGEMTDESSESALMERRLQLLMLKRRLWDTAHQTGAFPSDWASCGYPQEEWQTPGLVKVAYVYRQAQRGDGTPLAWEPNIFGDRQLVLYSDGIILCEDHADLERKLAPYFPAPLGRKMP